MDPAFGRFLLDTSPRQPLSVDALFVLEHPQILVGFDSESWVQLNDPKKNLPKIRVLSVFRPSRWSPEKLGTLHAVGGGKGM